MNILYQSIIRTGQSLLSEDQENPEYDRAIVELIADLTGSTEADAAVITVARDLGVSLIYIYPGSVGNGG